MIQPEPRGQFAGVLTRLEDNQAFVIARSGFRIGREKRCDLIIPDRSVSRLHAEITFSRGVYMLRDLGRTATRVNDQKVNGAQQLKAGDVIKIGKQEFRFHLRPASAEELAAASEVTPVMASVPDAPTMMPAKRAGGQRFFWLFLLAAAAFVAWMLLSS